MFRHLYSLVGMTEARLLRQRRNEKRHANAWRFFSFHRSFLDKMGIKRTQNNEAIPIFSQ